jgi:hypothetical protein
LEYLTLALTANAVTVATIYLITNGNIRLGAVTGFAGQILWLTYIYLTAAWAFIPGDVFIFWTYCKHIYNQLQR